MTRKPSRAANSSNCGLHAEAGQAEGDRRYFRDALIPGAESVGGEASRCVYETPAPEAPVAFLLIPYQSLDQMAAAKAGLEADAEYQKAAADT